MGKMNWFVVGVISGLTAAAIGQELAKPPAERSWKGRVAGVPYNFRLNEWPDIATEYWNPDSDEIFSPHAVGLGWGVNFAAVARRAQGLVASAQSSLESRSVASSGADSATTPARARTHQDE
ncbi:MAG TPA: DUF5808 domain-containing protein [Ktedonobacterales bacterium]|nr:DUF5808 domain-containing protein [Ktedonobacterales bacterium]